MRNNRLLALVFGTAGAVLLVTTVTALTVGTSTVRFTGADECLDEDPPAGDIAIKENVEPRDVYTIRKFVTNTCGNTINVEISLDKPGVDFIDTDSDDIGVHSLVSGGTKSATATVTFGNNTPANFSAKDVLWKVGRPE